MYSPLLPCQLRHGYRLLLTVGLAALMVTTTTFPLVAEKIREPSSEAEFDKIVTFTHQGRTFKLEATGTSIRRKWFVKGYAVAHYAEQPVVGSQQQVLDDIYSTDKAKQITILWLHELPLALVREGYKETLEKILTPTELQLIESDVNRFVGFFNEDAKVDDVYFIRWLPGGYVELILNDKKLGAIVNADLAKAIWNIWLGKESVVNRKSLIGLKTRE